MSIAYPNLRKIHEAMWIDAPPHPETEKWMAMRWLDTMQNVPVATLDEAEAALVAWGPRDDLGFAMLSDDPFPEPAETVVSYLDPHMEGAAQIVAVG